MTCGTGHSAICPLETSTQDIAQLFTYRYRHTEEKNSWSKQAIFWISSRVHKKQQSLYQQHAGKVAEAAQWGLWILKIKEHFCTPATHWMKYKCVYRDNFEDTYFLGGGGGGSRGPTISPMERLYKSSFILLKHMIVVLFNNYSTWLRRIAHIDYIITQERDWKLCYNSEFHVLLRSSGNFQSSNLSLVYKALPYMGTIEHSSDSEANHLTTSYWYYIFSRILQRQMDAYKRESPGERKRSWFHMYPV